MNRLIRLLAAFVLSFSSLSPVGAGAKTDREQAVLQGPVHTVRTEKVFSTYELGTGTQVTTTYDSRGHKTEEIRGSPDASWVEKTSYTYDAQGNVTVVVTYDANGALLHKRTFANTYDTQGHLTERLLYEEDSLIERKVYTYSAQGYLTGTASYDAEGNTVGREVYDVQERPLEGVTYADGGIKHKVTNTYDAHGNCTGTFFEVHGPLEGVARFDARGTLLEETLHNEGLLFPDPGGGDALVAPPPRKLLYSYDWDARGNWVKQTVTSCTVHDTLGVVDCKPVSVTHRTITYYEGGQR